MAASLLERRKILKNRWNDVLKKSYGCVIFLLQHFSEHKNGFQPVVRVRKEQTCIHVSQIFQSFLHQLQSSSLICFCFHVGSRNQTTAML